MDARRNGPMDAAGGGPTVNMAILDDTDIICVERCRSSKKSPTEIELDFASIVHGCRWTNWFRSWRPYFKTLPQR
jgi:hypothetical protein